MMRLKWLLWITLSLLLINKVYGQTVTITGKVTCDGKPVALANIGLTGTEFGMLSDSFGYFFLNNIPTGNYKFLASCIGYKDFEKEIIVKYGDTITLDISLKADNKTLNEIVVTGVSRATFIRENPVSIVPVSSKAIEKSNESNIIEVLVKNVPGLSTVKTGPNISKPFIRGLGYNRVLNLYDGIRQEGQQWGDEHGIEVDAYNIDRAEVIKGPASLMYGSDALAGVVSLFPFIPKEDDGKLHGKFTGEYQTNNNLIGSGTRLDYGNKHFLFALRGSYRIAKNFRNAIDGRVYNTGFEEKNLSALFGYKNDRGYSHFNITVYDNLQGIPDGSRDSISRKFTKQVEEGEDDDIKSRPVVSKKELNTYRLSPLHQHIRHYRAYMNHFYQVGKGNMDFRWGIQQNIREEYTHPTLSEQPGMNLRLNTMNYDLRYNAPRFKNIELSAGINGLVQQNKSLNATDFPIPDYHLYDGGIYLYATWKYNKWSTSAGVRYDLRHIQWDNFYLKTNPATGFDERTTQSEAPTATLQFPAYEKTFGGMSASLGLTYEATKEISFKANMGKGYRSPNITEMASNGLDPGAHIVYVGNKNFNPEFSLQEDLGISVRFSDFSTDLSFFNNNIQDYIYLTMLVDANGNPTIDPQGNKTFQYQQASAQLYGMEAWFSLHLKKLKGFSFENSFSVVYGFNRKDIFQGKGVNGAYLPLIPPLKLLSGIAQKIELKSKLVAAIIPRIEWEFSAAQNRYLKLNNTETSTSAYSLLNIGISTEIVYSKEKTLQLQLQVNNLLDQSYQSNLSRLKYFEYYTASSNRHSGIYNMGRNVCMKIILPF